MPHSINGRQIFEQMGGEWPKTTAEILAWARTHEECPIRFLDELRASLPDRVWPDWDALKQEVENYTWTMPDSDGAEDVVWGGAAPEAAVFRAPEPAATVPTPPEIVILTGSSGLIGSAVAQRLARGGLRGDPVYHVVGFDVEAPSRPLPAAEAFVYVDITSDESVREGLEHVRERHGDRIASVVHLAAYYDFSGEPSPKYEAITVRGTERLLRELQRFQVEQFLFSSTMLVHAPCEPGQQIDEEWRLEPKWAYPQSKVETEELIRGQHGEIPIVVLRLAGVYDDRCHSVPLAHQIQRIYERRLLSHVFPGDTSHGQSFLHLDDLVDAVCLLVERRAPLAPERTLLLGEPETLSYDELQREFGRLIHGEEWETRHIPKALAKAGAWLQDVMPGEEPFIKPWMIDLADDHYALDIRRARTVLGWKPQRSLRETLPKMVAALKADPLGWYRASKLEPPSKLQQERHGMKEEEAHAPRASSGR